MGRANQKAGVIQFAIPSYVQLPIFFQYDCLPRWDKIPVQLHSKQSLSQILKEKQFKTEVHTAPSRIEHTLPKIQTGKNSEIGYIQLPKQGKEFGRWVINTTPTGYGIPQFIPNEEKKEMKKEEENVNKNAYGKANLALPLQPLEVYGPFKSKLDPNLLQEHNIF